MLSHGILSHGHHHKRVVVFGQPSKVHRYRHIRSKKKTGVGRIRTYMSYDAAKHERFVLQRHQCIHADFNGL